MSQHSSETFLFEGTWPKTVACEFDARQRTSDAGASLLGAIDRKLKLTATLCWRLVDRRDPSRVAHTYHDLLRQRVFSIALGYADGNDSARVGQDPAMKMVCGRELSGENALSSQPTLSRFEHAWSGREVIGLGRELEDFVITRLRKRHPRARLITIDLDPSVDPTHGQQPLAFFNGHYDTWCYLPMFGFLSIDNEPEQHLFHARLRPGVAKEVRGTVCVRTGRESRRPDGSWRCSCGCPSRRRWASAPAPTASCSESPPRPSSPGSRAGRGRGRRCCSGGWD
jgi:hypothetical protein